MSSEHAVSNLTVAYLTLFQEEDFVEKGGRSDERLWT